MDKLKEVDQVLTIVVSVGFTSGIVYGIIDEVFDIFIIKNREIKLENTVRKCLVVGITEAVVLGVITFTLIATTSIPTQAIVQSIVGIAVSFAVVGSIPIKVFDFLLFKFFSQHQE